MTKINITVIEVFDDNKNCWEWYAVVRTDDVDMKKERKEAYANYFGDTYMSLEKETRDHIDKTWKKNTKTSDVTLE